MIPSALAVLLGTLCLQLSPTLPSSSLCGVLLVAAVFLAMWPQGRIVSVCLAGYLWAASCADARMAADLPPDLEGPDLQVQGTIVSLPEIDGRATRFLFEIRTSDTPTDWLKIPRTVRLSWYDGPRLQAGQGWRLNVRLKRRHGFLNPGGFDYEGWLLQHGISATGYVRQTESNQPRIEADADAVLVRWRQAVDQRLQAVLAEVAQNALLRALTLGADDGIPARQWAVFRATGTSHLVAISGMHISLVAGFGFAVTRWLWSRSTRLTDRLAAPRAAAAVALLLATLYAVLAGFGIPTRRAWIMALVLLSGVVLGQPTRPAHTLALALLCVLLCDPFAVLSPGFWLSFVAVAIIFARLSRQRRAATTHLARLYAAIRELVRLQWALSLGLLPLTLLLFGQFGWVAPFANLLAVPWTTLVLMPLVFAGLLALYPFPPLAQGVFNLAGWAAACMDQGLTLLAALPGTQQGMPSVPVWVSLLAFAGVALLLLPRGTPQRALGWLAVLPLATWSAPRPEPGAVWFTLLDVGQGLAAIVRTREHTLVFDAGPRFSSDFDTGTAVVAPFLAAHGIRRVDTLIISHGDNDHRGGAAALSAHIPVYRVLTSVPQHIEWRYSRRCAAGQAWQWDGVHFRILHPRAEHSANGNDGSCVLQVEAANGARVLVPGDIEAPAERDLVARFGKRLRSQILIAPHHGSRTSSTSTFIEAVAPDEVLIPAGHRNRYGFPHPTVSSRYQAFGARQWRTGASGALHLELGTTAPIGERQRLQRYWHRPVAVPPER